MSKERGGDWIQTYTGGQFWPIDPRPEDINIRDIAHALSMICRFGGHCRKFYSVAEHSVLLARATSLKNAFWALMHDASEAYLFDVPRPIKPYLVGYSEAEAKIMLAVCSKFGLSVEQPTEVKDLDARIMTDERVHNLVRAPKPWNFVGEPLGVELQFWDPETAEAEFLGMFYALKAQLPGGLETLTPAEQP